MWGPGGDIVDYVLLDTSVLVNCTFVNAANADPELLATIFSKVKERGIKVLLPIVVEFEYGRKVPEELERIRKQAKRFVIASVPVFSQPQTFLVFMSYLTSWTSDAITPQHEQGPS